MNFWQKTALSAALTGAVGIGAAMAPTVSGQSWVRAVEPADVQVISFGGGRLGVTISDVGADDSKGAPGVRIDEVEEGSPAQEAGFQKGDVVTEFDGERVRSARQFSRLVSETAPGRQVTAIVSRNGQPSTLSVRPRSSSTYSFMDRDGRHALETLHERLRVLPAPAPPTAPRAPRPPEPLAIERFFYSSSTLGVATNGLSDQLREYFGAKGGLLVTSVREDSTAAAAGVKAGDVIVSVNGRSVDDSSELRREIQRLDPGEEFTLEIVRDRKTMSVKGRMEERTSRRRTIL